MLLVNGPAKVADHVWSFDEFMGLLGERKEKLVA